jgi:transcriptional regulator with XRE-family HTH domain
VAQGASSGRDELSRSLRALRETAGLSQVRAGELTGIGQRKISRFENGLYTPDLDELSALVRVYGADDATFARLRELVHARLAEPRRSRVTVRRGNVATIQHRTRLLEEKAQTIEAFQTSTVIGLVQSMAYIQAVFNQPDVADADEAIAERLARQGQIVGSDKHVVVIHTEGALRSHLHSPEVMAAQLHALAELATAASNLRLGIIPWTRPVSRPLMSGFRLFDRKVLAVSSEIGEVLVEDPADLEEFGALFDQLTEWAEFGESAARIVRKIEDEYRALQA